MRVHFSLTLSMLYYLCQTGHRLGHPDAIHGGRGDPPGVARPLSTGEETPEGGLEGVVPKDAYRGGGAGLHSGKQRPAVGKAVELALQQGQGRAEGVGHIVGQAVVQAGGGDPRAVGGSYTRQALGGPSGEEVGHRLDWGVKDGPMAVKDRRRSVAA